jgi:peroxiredoxin
MSQLIPFILFFSSLASFAQNGHRINFKVHGWKDTTVYLGRYHGESTVIIDTTEVNAVGAFAFQSDKLLPCGVYFLVKKTARANIKVFEFVVGDDQTFSLETTSPDYVDNMKVVGDNDNALFFEDISFRTARYKEAEPYIKVLKDSSLTGEQKKDARQSFSKVSEKVKAHQKNLMTKHPRTITVRVMKAFTPIEVPAPPRKANGNIDSTFQLKYYRQHYFDNFDLADDALIRLPQPVYQQKLKEYLGNLFVPQPDSVTKAVYAVVERAKKNQETYQYAVLNCMSIYQHPAIMGLDEVFANLYDQYIKTGEMDYGLDAKTKQNIQEYADKIRSSMIGRLGANLIMQNENLQPKSLYDVKANYTILYFFRPDCSHCREETPKLVGFYNKSKDKFGLEVFAVSSDTSMKKLRDFIKEFNTKWITVDGPRSYIKKHFLTLYHADTTPTIYILDDKKKIIAKGITVEQLDSFLTRHDNARKLDKSSHN